VLLGGAEDAPAPWIDIDPYHPASAHELHAIGAADHFRAKRLSIAADDRHHALAKLGKRAQAPFTSRIERTVLLPLAVRLGRRGSRPAAIAAAKRLWNRRMVILLEIGSYA
jgi:hypothetical protein